MDFKYRAIESPHPSITGHTTHHETSINAAMDFKQRAIDVQQPTINVGGLSISTSQKTDAQMDMRSVMVRRLELEAEVRRELCLERQLALSRAGASSYVDPFMLSCFSSAKPLHQDAFMSRMPVLGFGMHGGVLGHASEIRRGVLGGGYGSPMISEGSESHRRDNVALVGGSMISRIVEVAQLEGSPNMAAFTGESTTPRIVEVTPSKAEEIIEQLGSESAEKNGKIESQVVEKQSEEQNVPTIVSKKSKRDWTCSICQVETTGEHALKDHLKGKKHKSKEASLMKQKTKENIIQHLPNIIEELIDTNDEMKPAVAVGMKRKAEALAITHVGVNNALDDTSDVTKKNLMCSLCQVPATSQKNLEMHFKGKKHKAKEASLNIQKGRKIICATQPLEQSEEKEILLAKQSTEKEVICNKAGVENKKTEDASLSTIMSEVSRDNLDLMDKSTVIDSIENTPTTKDEDMAEAMQPTIGVGNKRKAEAQAVVDVEVHNAPDNTSKVTKKDWSCFLCQVIATSEQALEDHFKGKKHKAKEASSNKQKAPDITSDEGTVEQTEENEVLSKKQKTEKGVICDEVRMDNKVEDALSSKHFTEESICDKAPVDQGPIHHKFWCKLCQVATSSAASMDVHMNGEEHWKMLLKRQGGVIIISTKSEDA